MNNSNKIIAVIPARSGSKSIPKKNIRLLGNKPLIAYSIATALSSSAIERVIVSTDSEEIADIARQYGAEVPFIRPAELSQDHSLDIEYQHHLLTWLSAYENKVPTALAILRPTHPLRRIETVNCAIKTFLETPHIDSLRSVRLAEQSPYKMWLIDEDGLLMPVIPDDTQQELYNQPRQQLPKVYWQDGYIDISYAEIILQKKSTTGDRILPFLIQEKTIDVDYESDFKKLEAAYFQENIEDTVKQERLPS